MRTWRPLAAASRTSDTRQRQDPENVRGSLIFIPQYTRAPDLLDIQIYRPLQQNRSSAWAALAALVARVNNVRFHPALRTGRIGRGAHAHDPPQARRLGRVMLAAAVQPRRSMPYSLPSWSRAINFAISASNSKADTHACCPPYVLGDAL